MHRLIACSILLAAAEISAAEPFTPPAVKDPDATIHSQMTGGWKSPQRLLWRISYHPIKAMEAQSSWHIDGTEFWVRIHPEWHKLDEFDKKAVYEIDAVALEQNFGTIDFYVYRHQKVTK